MPKASLLQKEQSYTFRSYFERPDETDEIVARYCDCQVRIEYGLTVNNWLKGNLDDLRRWHQSLVGGKLRMKIGGFTQLAVAMMALAQVEDQDVLFGAVTIDDAWRLGRLDRQPQQISQDIILDSVPDDLPVLMQVLIGIVEQ
jgi:hypothetical protein